MPAELMQPKRDPLPAGVGQLDGRVMAPAPKRAEGGPRLRVAPCSLREAQAFVARLHRHHKDQPLPGHKMSLGVEACTRLADGEAWALVGVAMIGNPSAPALQKDRRLVEIRRVCTDGTPNACSMLYGAARRALRAMGYETIITYTLPEEGGASLRAAGFVLDKADAGGCAADWHNRAGRKALPVGTDLVGGKWRWLG
jgi:hypothetical protein